MRKKILYGLLLTVVLMAGLLVWHIQAVTSKPPVHLSNMQLALIRFETPLDASEAATVRSAVQRLPGVGHCYVNAAEGALSYSFDRSQQTSEQVFAHVEGLSPVACTRVTVSSTDLAGSCPVISKTSTTGKLSAWIAGWFN